MIAFQLRFLVFFVAVFSLFPAISLAQETQSLSVTPPLFQISVAPGGVWQSSVKVVNNNRNELVVYAEVVNFAPVGENGQGRFIPVVEERTEGKTFAEWIDIEKGPYVIDPEKSTDIPFFVDIPADASPGGHFAAILISTEPPANNGELAVRTSQVVTSLFFVRVAGDINESGVIREFSVTDTFVELPEASFVLRFENKGNVHLQPRGDVLITNMWGKERGIIPINYQTNFGNVLPESIREFKFTWKGEPSITDIGRYKAVATLTFGEEEKQNVSVTTYFWVIPVKATLTTLALIGTFIWLITWMIKLYIRRMLVLAGVDVDTMEHVGTAHTIVHEEDVRVSSYRRIVAPITDGALDLRSRLSGITEIFGILKTVRNFILNYRIFFGALIVLIGGFVGIVFYISDVAKDQRSYEVQIDKEDGRTIVVDSEEIVKAKLEIENDLQNVNENQHFTLKIINATNEVGSAARLAIQLEKLGYRIDTLETDRERRQLKTAIIYDVKLLDEATALSETLNNALLSARTESDDNTSIVIILGQDLVLD